MLKSKKMEKGIFETRTDKVIPIRSYTEGNYFLYEDGRIMDIMQIVAKDLFNSGLQDLEYDFGKHWKFHKMNAVPYKQIAINFPYDTQIQQEYWKRKMENTKNPCLRKWQETSLAELKWLEANKTKREFYLMFFTKDEREHREFILQNIQIMSSGRDVLLKECDFEKKCQILHKLANQNLKVH